MSTPSSNNSNPTPQTAPAPLPANFTINFKTKTYKIVEFKTALYSKKFRDLTGGKNIDQLTIDAPVDIPIFDQFINAIQGEEYTISSDNYLDLFSLSIIWEVVTLYVEIWVFIQETPDVNSVINKLLAPDPKLIDGLDKIIAANFDKAVKNEKFGDLPLPFIEKCLKDPEVKIKDMHAYFNFVNKMLEKHGPQASSLADGLDFYYLTRDEALDFLDNPKLDPVIAVDALIKLTKLYANETNVIDEKITTANNRISSLQGPSTAIETILERIQLLQDDVDDLATRISSFAKNTMADVADIDKNMASVERKAKAESKKQNSDFEDLTNQIKLLESKFEATKILAQESKPKSPVKPKLEDPDDEPVAERHMTVYKLNQEEPLNGIITALTAIANGNVHENGIVKITASSTDHSNPQQVVDRGWNDFWFSQNKQGQWIMFDFIQRQIAISDYTIKTIKFSEDSCHLKTWCIEGSLDCSNWTLIDEQDTDALNGPNKIVSFKCKTESEPYRYIRLRMTNSNARGDNLLALNNIEFFGVLVDM